MKPLVVSSPHAHRPLATATVMQRVALASVPGLVALIWFFGWGVVVNLFLAVGAALATEAAIVRLRGARRSRSFRIRQRC